MDAGYAPRSVVHLSLSRNHCLTVPTVPMGHSSARSLCRGILLRPRKHTAWTAAHPRAEQGRGLAPADSSLQAHDLIRRREIDESTRPSIKPKYLARPQRFELPFLDSAHPHGLAIHVHNLGADVRELGVFFNHIVELGIPWLIIFPVHRRLLVPWVLLTCGLLWSSVGDLSLLTTVICGGTACLGWVVPRWLGARERMSSDDGRWARITAAIAIIVFMTSIAATGNYGFFNLLTIALTLSCLDDQAIMACVPRGLKDNLAPPIPSRPPSRFWFIICVTAACVLVPWNLNRGLLTLGGEHYANAKTHEKTQLNEGVSPEDIELSTDQRFWLWLAENDRDMNEKMGAFHIVRRYGLFATMTTERYELRIEGSEDGRVWKPFKFRYKPNSEDDLHFAATHRPRLDWQMWFVSLWSGCQGRAFFQRNRWFFHFLDGILAGSKPIMALLKENPFPDQPPRYVRVLRDRARFSTPEEYAQTGQPWVFERVKKPFCPVLDRNSLRRSGIHRTQ